MSRFRILLFRESYILAFLPLFIFITVTTYLQAPYTVWSSGRGVGQPFVLTATISYPEGLFVYPLSKADILPFYIRGSGWGGLVFTIH